MLCVLSKFHNAYKNDGIILADFTFIYYFVIFTIFYALRILD